MATTQRVRPRELKALRKATTEVTIHNPTTAMPNKVFIEPLLYLWLLPLLNFLTNRLLHSQTQRGLANVRTECTRTSEFHALYRAAPGTVLLRALGQTPIGCVGSMLAAAQATKHSL